jgi:hypothetical protein
MSGDHSNLQTHLLLITDPGGRQWIVGTGTQRGFTSAGVGKAFTRALEVLPTKWKVQRIQVTPVSEILAVSR